MGVMLFEALTGMTPFHAATPHEIVLQHLDTEPPRPSTLFPRRFSRAGASPRDFPRHFPLAAPGFDYSSGDAASHQEGRAGGSPASAAG